MAPFVAIVISGLLATAIMTLVMYFIHWSRMANGDMIRAIGSFLTKDMKRALPVGTVVHFVLGVVFAFIYFEIFNAFGFESVHTFIAAGLWVGLVQGFIVSFIMIILVAEHHPIESFRKVGFPVALLYFIGHAVYGVSLGYFLQYFLS